MEWLPGGRHEDSYAVPLAPAGHWDLVDIIAIVSREHKAVGSTLGHPLAHTSPFYQARLGALQGTLQRVRRAILEKDFPTLGALIEEEAIFLHVAAMTSRPSVLYWRAGTINVMHALRDWRADGRSDRVLYNGCRPQRPRDHRTGQRGGAAAAPCRGGGR